MIKQGDAFSPRGGAKGHVLLAPAIVASALAAGMGLLAWALQASVGLPSLIALHAAGMIAAWGVMMPAGGIVARYFKVTRHQNYPDIVDNPFWWNWHRGLQYGGLLLATLALAAILRTTGGAFDTWHGRCGLLVMAIGWLQVFSAAIRGSKGGATDMRADPGEPSTWRGDHYDMTRRRRLFEAWHKRAGWAVLALASVTILLGIDLVGAPDWLLVMAGLLQGATLCALVDGAVRGRWVDTYAALWGPDPVHPGNPGHRADPARRGPPTPP